MYSRVCSLVDKSDIQLLPYFDFSSCCVTLFYFVFIDRPDFIYIYIYNMYSHIMQHPNSSDQVQILQRSLICEMQKGSKIICFQFLFSLTINLEPEKTPKFNKSYKMLIRHMINLGSSEILANKLSMAGNSPLNYMFQTKKQTLHLSALNFLLLQFQEMFHCCQFSEKNCYILFLSY